MSLRATAPQPAYDDSATLGQLHHDGRATAARLGRLDRAARRATGPTPSLRAEDRPRESTKRDLEVSSAAAALAAAIYGVE